MSDIVRVSTAACRRGNRLTDEQSVEALMRSSHKALGLEVPEHVSHTPTGHPMLRDVSLEVSVTHDAGCAALATATSAVGVDLQHVTDVSARFRQHLATRTRGSGGPWGNSQAVCSWVIRESISKCRGLGLADAPWRYVLDAATGGTYEECHWRAFYLAEHGAWLGIASASRRSPVIFLNGVRSED